MKNEIIVNAVDLRKSFGDLEAVAGISFSVHRGEFLGVLGPNGAGKTTTLRMLLGLVLPTKGSLSVLNFQLPAEAKQLHHYVGVVPQQNNLDPDFSVRENLRIYAMYFGLRGRTLSSRIDELLEFAALTHKADAKVTTLSGGMKRRLILARALINDPQLLILDEPTTGLDPQARQLIWARLRSLRTRGVTLILTTHYMEEAERLCDRILVVDHGKILAEGSPKELVDHHIEAHVIEVREGDFEKLKHAPVERMERVGETLFCYCQDEKPLLRLLQQTPEYDFLHRRANLEDVFLKLTGRELREN